MFGLFLSDSTYDEVSSTLVQMFPQPILKSLNEHWLFPLRRRYLTQILSPYLRGTDRVLDLGASDGHLAFDLQQSLANRYQQRVTFTGCDVHVQPETYIPIVSYHGDRLPFADDFFDCVLIVDVLHHAENPRSVLQEAKRVSSQRILVKDHYWSHPKEFTRLKFADYIGNKPYNIRLPYRFFTQSDWQTVIADSQLSVMQQETFRFNLFDPCQHILFELNTSG